MNTVQPPRCAPPTGWMERTPRGRYTGDQVLNLWDIYTRCDRSLTGFCGLSGYINKPAVDRFIHLSAAASAPPYSMVGSSLTAVRSTRSLHSHKKKIEKRGREGIRDYNLKKDRRI
ncbi:hypothetical protein RRG08_002664 [Elysia crispata]|uniref:Uncharacterized protein n=1 Tax=Elysia crispata TaxID=231223 RepID=A0AAE0XU65_9GAST|nr:hypothetical protein RRG08_002664 [Elysia crispata]